MNEYVDRVVAFLARRKHAYQLTFPRSPAQMQVLADLAKFCRADTTTFHADPRIHAVLEGRREVFLRIANHLNLTPEQLYAIYNAAGPQPTEK